MILKVFSNLNDSMILCLKGDMAERFAGFILLWAVSSTSEAKACAGRLFRRGKRLEMH